MQASQVPKILRDQFGDPAVLGLLDLCDTAHAEWKAEVLTASTERFERRLSEECSKIRLEMERLRGEMTVGFAAIRLEMTQGFAAQRVELLKWSFLFWVGQVVATAAIVGAVVRSAR